MASQLQIYNSALRHLGANSRLTSLSEARPNRYVMDDCWNSGLVDYTLSQAGWKFAKRTVKLTPNASVTPLFGFANAFDKPTDHLRTMALCEDEYLNYPLTMYSAEGNYWFADVDEIYVAYVSNGASYGADLTRWAVNFTKYVELYLAMECSTRIEGSDVALKTLAQRMKMALSEAKSSDAMEDPTKFFPPGNWVQSKGGGRARRDRGNRGNLIG